MAKNILCPHCSSVLLWSDDRGAHCDGCDLFTADDAEALVNSVTEYKVTTTVEFMGYTIIEKRDFPKESPMSGFVVTKNGANIMPGACWFHDVKQAQKGIAAYVLACKIAPVTYDGGIHTCEPGIFWMLMELVK